MTSVEKRRSGRKSGGHRKHSDGGYSDTSSAGSFLDETDREVSNLTDRAFRSLCIGDEAVYNDSDLCSSSPSSQRDRQLAFSQGAQDGEGKEDGEREDLKRAAHESFSLRVQQYGQDWIHGGVYGAKVHRDPQWEVYGERTQGRVSATFQHSFVETSQQEESLREEQMSFLCNGATELSSQQRRSRSRVSSLIRAFNSDGHRDGAGAGVNDETSWDKSALMSIQRELSEFSTSYQQNYNSGSFSSSGPFSSRDTNFYSSEVGAVAHMNSESSFMRSSHSKHSVSAQVNCNSNFFIHSEFSPFKVWRNYNRFPFRQGEVSGFVHCSEFPRWYETPMYKELSLEAQPQGPYRFDERGVRHPRNHLAPAVPPTSTRSTSTSTMMQKALAVEKRCESELAGHFPHKKRAQSLGTNRLTSQRPSTASPTVEMSRRVQDTISSVKALQQKIKMMTEENISSGMTMTANQQRDHLIPFGDGAKTVAPNVVSSNTSTTPFSISQMLTPLVHSHQETEASASPQPVEHAPVRAESRGATPDVRMSSYKSRATSLLFNLKDNRKRVKTTYSPPKFKGLETLEKSKQPSTQEPRDTVIDIPDFPDTDTQFLQVEESSRTNAATHQYVNQYYSPGLSLTTQNSQPVTAHAGQYLEYTASDYQPAQMQGEMVHHSGFTGFMPGNYTSNQLANGQNLHEDVSSFTPYKQGMMNNAESLWGDANRLKPSYTAAETPRLNADTNQTREYLKSKSNNEQQFNETAGREFIKADRYQQLKENKHDYRNVSSQDRWRQTSSQDTESLKTAFSPWKQEITAVMEKGQHAQAYDRAATVKEELNLTRYRENQQSLNKELEKTDFRESFGVGTSFHKTAGLVNPNILNQQPQYDTEENPAYYGQQQHGGFKEKYGLQKNYGHNKENEMKENNLSQNYIRYTDQEYRNQQSIYKDKAVLAQETSQRKPTSKEHEMQPTQMKPQSEHNIQTDSLSHSDNASLPTLENRVEQRHFAEVKAEQTMSEHIKAQHTQAELAKVQHWAKVEQPKVESSSLILAGQTGSEKEQAKSEPMEYQIVNQTKAEYIKKRKEEQAAQSRDTLSDQAREEQTKAEQTRVREVAEEPKIMTGETGAKYMQEVQGEQVKAERVGAERLKEEHIKTRPARQAGQERIKQTDSERTRAERIKVEPVEGERVREELVERERVEAEQIRTEEVKAEQAEVERKKAEQAKQEQTKEQEAKAKAKVVEDDSTRAGVNIKQLITQISKDKEVKVHDRKAEQAKILQTAITPDKLNKAAVKLPVIQQARSEPDRVQQVKIELAKAKAELAKIKEKMRGEQKEKVRNAISTKEDAIKKDVPLLLNVDKNEADRDQDQATLGHQQRKDSVVGRQSTNQANRGADEYERLREKYGFIDTTSTNQPGAAGNASLKDVSETPVDRFETANEVKDKHSPTNRQTASTEDKVEESSIASGDVSERHYVYSETSKEFKLSSADLPSNIERENSDTATDKVKNMTELEKCEPHSKPTDVSQQKHCDLAKPLPLERKPKSTEPSVGPGNDAHFAPNRALSSKERAQTKQEILTSKIKAHAEKEISAIKERGFAKRDGIMSKNTSKQLAGSQGINIRQRPPTQEMSKKPESTMPSNAKPKQQMEPSKIQMEPMKSDSPPSSATIPVKSAATCSQLVDHSQKQVPKEPSKSNNSVPEKPDEAKQTGVYTMNANDSFVENQRKENQYGIKSPMENKEQAPKNEQEKQEADNRETSGKQRGGHKDNPAVNTNHPNKTNKDDSAQTGGLVKAERSKLLPKDKSESQREVIYENSPPSLSFAVGQNEAAVVEDQPDLQIMGIMVTVKERGPFVNDGQRNNSTQEEMNAKEKESSHSVPDKCLEASRGHESLRKVIAKEGVVQTTAVMEDQTKVCMDNHLENLQERSTLETGQNNMSENVTVEKTNLQQVRSSTNTTPHRETQPLEPMTEKSVPSTVTVPAKNKALAATQPLLHSRDMIARETKDCTNTVAKESSAKSIKKYEVQSTTEEKTVPKGSKAHVNENIMAEVVNTGINFTNDSRRVHAEPPIKHDVKPSMEEDMTKVINPSKSRIIGDKSSPLLEEKIQDSTQPKTFNKTSPPKHLTENENMQVSPKDECKEIQTGENNEMDNNVHIGSIAIRVVSAVTEMDNLKTVEKPHVTIVPPDVVAANKHKQVVPSRHEERSQNLSLPNSEKQVTDSLGAEHALPDSTRTSHQQISSSITSERPVNKSAKPVEEDYFQVQRVEETNNEPNNDENVGNKATISNESCNEWKNEAFVLDQNILKTMESSSESTEDENMTRKNKENEEHLTLKQSDSPSEKQSHKKEKTEGDQAIHIRKQHTENSSSLSPREQQRSRNSHQTKENMVKEKMEIKPKPRERSSTRPEISALADYARLKVIVSEDRENPVQEFPPNKKEGFFPLIQTRHSRRPVFTADPQDLSVKVKSVPKKTEVTSQVNKEPKPLVFPITEKEHQRTGMFKLGDKDRPDKMLSDAKAKEDILDTGVKHTHHLKEGKSPTKNLKNQGSGEQVSGADTQRVHQVDQRIHPPTQATSSSAVNRPRTSSMSHQFLIEETTAKQSRARQLEEECTSKVEMNKSVEDMKIKNMIEERRALLAEEERKAAQREEERRAREREAIAIKIKERREKHREAERKAEEEIKEKQTEEERAAQKDKATRAKHGEETKIMKEAGEKRRMMIGEESRVIQREQERAAQDEQQRRAAQEGQQRAAQDEQQRIDAQKEQQRRAAQEEQQRAAQEEQQRRAAQEEQQRAAQEEQRRKAAQEEQQIRAAQEEQQRAAQEEQQRIAAQKEKQRRAAQDEQRRKAAQEEQQRRAAQDERQRAAQEEQQRRAAEEDQQRRAALIEEEKKRAAKEEQQRRAVQEEQKRKAAQEEQQRRAAEEDRQRRAALIEEEKRRAAKEEQQRRAAQEEQQRREALIEEQQRRAAKEEQLRRVALIEEQQRIAAEEEQQRRAAQEEQQRRTALIEKQQRKAAQEEQQRKDAEEQQRRAALIEEQQRRAAEEDQQRRAALIEEEKRRAAKEEQQRRAAQEEQQRKAAEEERQRRDAEEQQRRAALIEEQQRRAADEELQRRAVQKEQQERALQEEKQMRAVLIEEQQRKAVEEEQQSRATLIEEQRRAKKIEELLEEEKKRNQREEEKYAQISKEGSGGERMNKEEWIRYQSNQVTLKEEEEKRAAEEDMLAKREDENKAKRREEEQLAVTREKERTLQMEEQKRAAQRIDALQYYAITSTETERKVRERLSSPLPSQRRNNPSGLESAEDSNTRSHRPHAPASPAPSLPRSTTSSPALGVKPSMFRVKDNTIRGSFTKSVKPRFHKNFGEDFRVGSPMGSERGEEEQEIIRRSATTPVHPDIGINRLAAIKESSAISSQDYSTPLPYHRPYSRRSFALDEDDSRSMISNMSEDVESFATSATDLADVRGLCDYDRPESACSFSSDVSRSMGKPPVVPPKSEKALKRAQRLTTRRIKKELSKTVADKPLEKDDSSIPSYSSIEVRSPSRHAVASPHFSQPISLAHAPKVESSSSLPSSHTEHKASRSSFQASPHATGPISLPAASPHAIAPLSLPVPSPHATGPASHPAAPKTIADVPSSPTLHHANHPAPVTQYHVESSYPQSYPLTQRKVLQDLGSGQYFVVDVPVQVKTKTFFDPETGKYVQLNVRESSKSTSRPQPQQTYLQPQLQPQIHVKPHQKPFTKDSPGGNPHVLYQGYHQGYQPTVMNSVAHDRSPAPVTLHQDQQPVRESHSYGYPVVEMGQNPEGYHYSPEKAPYMDTVNDTDKTYNAVYNTHGTYESFPECDTNSQLAGSPVCENESSAHSRYQPRDIIAMSELDDFMELSDW